MTIRDIISLLDAEIISAADLDLEVKTACGSDMMSDVLAFVKDQSVLLTGLLNPQVVRTAEMMDMRCIVFVRGKQPDDSIVELAKKMASDGEGATHLITCTVTGAGSEQSAETVAKSVIGSALTKAAIFGADANWGRVLCAMGYSKAPFRPEHVDVTFRSAAGELLVCKQGEAVDFDEAKAKEVLSQKEVIIAVDLHEGEDSAECWGCDLTYDYVKINGDYRT